MANNEHKNLSNANLHVPKDFSTASNSTTLTKDSSGNLSWISNTSLGKQTYTFSGYSQSDLVNAWRRAQPMTDGQSPNQYATSLSTAVFSEISISPTVLMKQGAHHVIVESSTVYKIYGWVSAALTNPVKIGIGKITPTENSLTNLTPVLVDEISVTGLGSLSKMIAVNETTITSASLAAGDFLVAYLKEEAEGETGGDIFFHLQVCTTTY
tara:strand:- start:1653 stop:2285 length:633 start_codon:yes stop_codon:yes gene_type:complete